MRKLPEIKIFLGLVLVFLVVLLDQASKLLAAGFLKIVCNHFGPFGLNIGSLVVYVGVLIFVSYAVFTEKRRITVFGFLLIFAGGFSNIVDRLVFGCVRDFVSVLNFPTFNLADTFISIGVVIVVVCYLVGKND